MTNPFRKTEGVTAHRLSATRLYGILLIFLVLSAYAIWKSERFQNLMHGVSQQRLSEALGVAVSFQTVQLRVFPPAVLLADVRIGNDPRSGLPADRPLLTAEEISIGGGVSLVGRQLRLGRIRAVRPQIRLVESADGSFNLPPGLAGPARGGLKPEIGSVLVQQGIFEFEGHRLGIDGRFDDFAAELATLPGRRYRGTLVARRARIDLPGAEPLLAGLSVRLTLDPKRGVTFDDVRLEGAFGQVRASGSIEKLAGSGALFAASAELTVEEVERIFRAELPFSGAASLRARVEIPAAGGFRVTGEVRAPRVRAEPFLLEDLTATVVAGPEALLARIERVGYSGGRVSGVFRIGNLAGKPQPMTLAAEAEGISLERFFADLGLPGTGLSGSAALTAALRWGKEGLTRADGGGSLRFTPGPASSLVPGRFGLPTSGGGAVSVVNGRIGFEGATFHFPQSSLEVAGAMQIGVWQPDFDVRLGSRDLTEVDRLFQNFVAATGGKPEPLGLAGTGGMEGHLSGTWNNPDATMQLSCEETRYANVPFGGVRGTVDMHDGAFFFRPLRVYDGEAGLSLEGMARYRIEPGHPRFDLAVAAHAYPVSRVLEYLDLRYPVAGLLTGTFPVSGTPEAATGGGAAELRDAVVWGQKVPRLTGMVRMTPAHFAIEELRAEIGGGVVGGGGSISIAEKTFEARLAGDGVSLSAIDAWESVSSRVGGKLSFQFSGGGSFERPGGRLSAALSQASFFGHPLPEGAEPRLEATLERGILDGAVSVREGWSLKARGDLFGTPVRLALALDAADVNALLLFTPVALPAGLGGSLAAEGSLQLPEHAGEFPSGTFAVTRARLDAPDRPGVLSTSGTVRASLAGGGLALDEFEVVGEGTALKVAGSLAIAKTPAALELVLAGPVDASLLARAMPDLPLTGRLQLDLKATGSLDRPSLSGSLRLENCKYRLAGLAQIVDGIEGSITFAGSRGELEARARFGGGEASAAGSFRLEGLSIEDFRLAVQAHRVSLRYPEDLRLLADAELVAAGGPAGSAIRGQVVLLRGAYSRDFEVTLSDLLARSRPSGVAAAREPWKERTTLEVRIVSSAALEVRNNVARLTGTVDLVARGTLADPVLVGQVVLDEGGRVTFRDVRYEIDSGSITFAGSKEFAPIVDLRARAELKGYSLVVSLVGTWPRLQTTFSSDPPLPDESVVALLLAGSEPSQGTSGGSLATAAGGIVGSAATGVLTRPAQRILKLERFQIEPMFGATGFGGATATVGKQVSPNWLVTYSQPLFEAENRLPILQVEGRISQTWILRAARDENGIYYIDLRRRARQ